MLHRSCNHIGEVLAGCYAFVVRACVIRMIELHVAPYMCGAHVWLHIIARALLVVSRKPHNRNAPHCRHFDIARPRHSRGLPVLNCVATARPRVICSIVVHAFLRTRCARSYDLVAFPFTHVLVRACVLRAFVGPISWNVHARTHDDGKTCK